MDAPFADNPQRARMRALWSLKVLGGQDTVEAKINHWSLKNVLWYIEGQDP